MSKAVSDIKRAQNCLCQTQIGLTKGLKRCKSAKKVQIGQKMPQKLLIRWPTEKFLAHRAQYIAIYRKIFIWNLESSFFPLIFSLGLLLLDVLDLSQDTGCTVPSKQKNFTSGTYEGWDWLLTVINVGVRLTPTFIAIWVYVQSAFFIFWVMMIYLEQSNNRIYCLLTILQLRPNKHFIELNNSGPI